MLNPLRRALLQVLVASRYLRPSARRTVARITERLFDAEWYAARQGLPSAEAARQHYVANGAWVGLAPHPLVDPAWLCRRGSRKGLRRAPGPWTRARAVLLFATSAPSEARDPHLLFDVAWYQAAAQVPEDSPIDVLSHFLSSPRSSRRSDVCIPMNPAAPVTSTRMRDPSSVSSAGGRPAGSVPIFCCRLSAHG